jgi:CheY-like chemotaxis protein
MQGNDPNAAETAPGGNETGREVLVVDDDIAFANGLASVLHAHGYRARVAYDGDEALRQLAAHRVDIVLSDIVMPGMIGCTLVQAAHALPGHDELPFVFMSVLTEEKVQSFFDAGIRYLQKPFDTTALLSMLGDAATGPPPDPRRSTPGPETPRGPQRRAR